VVGKQARKVALPPNCSLIAILRGGEAITCFDTTVMASGDTVVALAPHNQEAAVREILLG
jgi:Trk K+ transport system NAD-binding subunit